MDELLQQVAKLRGMPASLVERSAQARADQTGSTVEEVLQEWAGETGKGEAAQTVDADTEAEAIDAATDSVDETEGSGPATSDEPEPLADEPKPTEVTTDYLVQLAADAKRMPPKLILSSATARSEHSDASLDEVLADWAGVDLEELQQQAAAEPTPDAQETTDDIQATTTDIRQTTDDEEAEPAKGAAVAAGAVAVAGVMSMDELLERVAEAKGMPASLAKRSAEAKAKKSGEPVEAVLAEWAGVDISDVATSAGGTEQSTDASSPVDKPEDESLETEADATDGVEIIEASSTETSDVAGHDDDAPVPRGRYPRWLAAAFVLIPLLAVGYILVTPNGPECGTAGQLLVDPVTGETVNCDGTEYGLSSVDYFAQGEGLYSQCVACHSADGSGGAGPAFSGGAVLATFPADSCGDHIEWIRLGTAGWPDQTYGATDKPVGGFGLMPAFGSMDDEQLASVALYERVQFGGQALEDAEIDCGLGGAEGESGESVEAAGS
ncbi:MAG: cytochrome c [Actinomycetia bacterium]|nr:cytochrome c [Actinomycetes bacterium]